ncbi:MAG: AAA family ATPase [Pirellulaceae bacterium]
MKLLDQVKAARRVSVPILSISTTDPAATVARLSEGINGDAPKIQWDIVRGVRPLNDAGAVAIAAFGDPDATVQNWVGTLTAASELPEGCVLFIHNANRYLDDPAFIQAIWNLRDQFKQDRRMLILLGCDITLPPELAGDVVSFDEPLPDQASIEATIKEVHDAAGLTVSDETLAKAVAATTGLPTFQVEQLTAMSLTPDGIVLDDLWERKRRQIEQTPGLSVYRGTETFEDVGGLASAKEYFYKLCTGLESPQAIVWIDEIDKQMSGDGDLSGISQDQLGALLTYMENTEAEGVLCLGPPGCSKSLIAKATGNEVQVPTVGFDFGAMKGGIVGQSETQIRNALKVVSSVSNSKPLFVATANSIDRLNTALLRRFPMTFYMDLPDRDEKSKIWPIHLAKQEVACESAIDDRNWSGADIRNCCKIARKLGCPVEIAAKWIVPVGVRSAKEIERLRNQANGAFLSASYPGFYRTASKDENRGRRLDLN